MDADASIAAVTHCLRDLLKSGLAAHASPAVSGAVVSVEPPGRVLLDAADTGAVDLYLYRVEFDDSGRNQHRRVDAAGDVASSVPLYLELHYMLSTRAVDEFDAQDLLGHGMRLLHHGPVQSLPGGAVFAIRPQAVDEQQASALWSSLQVPHRPAAFYRVSHELR